MKKHSPGSISRASDSVLPTANSSSECSVCGEKFPKPLHASISSSSEVSEYYACPRCLSEVKYEVHEERIADQEVLNEISLSEEEVQESSSQSTRLNLEEKFETKLVCEHELGYLKQRPKNTPIPDRCLICTNMIECMTH
jgi:DNA-directed RNA polymerase subunit RPC12/RpoP